VILDVLMPGKDGVEVLREVKTVNPIVEVIMLTGHGTIETAIEGLKLGAYDYLLKPTDTGELVAKILRAYARKSEQEDRIRRAEIANIVAKRGW
jgi:DNA-binding NtrC family response regulator